MPLKIRKWNLKEIVESAVKGLGSLTKTHNLTTRCRAHSPYAYCDEEMVRRIITNLVVNAIKFTPKGGEICVGIEADDCRMEISVQDNGPGISNEYHETIFKKFGQSDNRSHASFDSTGLGLTFCILAAESQGGEMDVESKVGEGSRFWFTLPTKDNMQ